MWPSGKTRTNREKVQEDKFLLNINEKLLGVKDRLQSLERLRILKQSLGDKLVEIK